MKYVKPQFIKVKIETQPIASSGLSGWLEDSEYIGAENYITNQYIGES